MDEEQSEYYKKMMEVLDRQVREVEEPARYSSIESCENYETEERVSKTALLKKLKEKYPYSDAPFQKYKDRDERQYSKLVSTKELNVAEFILKWEHEHGHRIHKNMAWELLTERKNKGSISDEFLKIIEKKFQE
jgi:hypothetical protein